MLSSSGGRSWAPRPPPKVTVETRPVTAQGRSVRRGPVYTVVPGLMAETGLRPSHRTVSLHGRVCRGGGGGAGLSPRAGLRHFRPSLSSGALSVGGNVLWEW